MERMRTTLLIGILVYTAFGFAAKPSAGVLIPESGFISSHQYISAYFGFVLPLPKGHFSVVDKRYDMWALRHDLLFVRSIDARLSISAIPVIDSAEDEVESTALIGIGRYTASVIDIGGRSFWKVELEEDAPGRDDASGVARRRWYLSYAVELRGFVIHFWASSLDRKLASELRRCIDSIEFFDRNQAAERAGKDSRPFLPKIGILRVASAPHTDIDHLDPGSIRANVYTNSRLGISYIFPTRWHAATLATSGRTERIGRWAGADTLPLARPTEGATSEGCERVLSWSTKFPEQAPAVAFNSRIVIFAADPMCFAPNVRFPGSVDDRVDIKLFANALTHALDGSSLLYRAKAARGTVLDRHLFFEVSGVAPIPPQQASFFHPAYPQQESLFHRAYRSLVLTTMNDYWVIWLFESDNESELYDLIKSGIILESKQSAADGAAR